MVGLLFQGTAAAQLFHWIFYPLTAGAVYLCARRYYGPRTALWAACFFIFTPAVFAQSGYPYVDLSLAFFIFLSVYAFLAARESGDSKMYALAGLFCGGAMGVKFLGLGCLLILFPLVFWESRFNLKKSFLFLGAAVLAGGAWYAKSWILAGNPVYPLFHGFFGGHGWAVQMDEGAGMGKNPAAFLFFPWNITMRPNAFGGQTLGALFLLLTPALLLERREIRPVSRCLALFTFGYTAFLFTQSQQARFFIAVTPFLSIAAAVGFARATAGGRLLRGVASGITAIILMLHLGIFVYRLRDVWPVVLGRQPAQAWLAEHERSFRGFDYLRNHVSADATVLNAAEVRYFYAPQNLRITHWPQAMVEFHKQGVSAEKYLQRHGFDYLWVSNTPEPAIAAYLEKKGYVPVFHYDFTEKPDIFWNVIYKKPFSAQSLLPEQEGGL